MQALDGAHSPGNTINSLAIFNSPITPLLVSGCKGGVLKLWNPETCAHNGKTNSLRPRIAQTVLVFFWYYRRDIIS